MRLKKNRLTAATSLIEIMMIFFIIGIVSAAGMSLTKPKNEYMKKIAIYAAYRDLATAANAIKNASYIDFSTDLDNCTIPVIGSTKTCPDKFSTTTSSSTFPSLNTVLALPKVAFRQTSDNTVLDPIFSSTDGRSVNYANLSNGQKALVKFYQNGFCQRLVSQFNLSDMNHHCATSNSDSSNLDDSAGFIQDFTTETPSLLLPNGYVYYISKHLYTDFGANFRRQKVNVESTEYGDDLSSIVAYTTGNNSTDFNTTYSGLSFYQSNTNSSKFIHYPSEIKLKMATNWVAYPLGAANQLAWLEYVQRYYLENKDYFNVYIDINGKMENSDDITKGPDKLNEDVFLFHVYRNGAVKPAYESGFPLNYLTGGVNYRVKKDDGKQYKITYAQYAQRPLGYAQCIAGVAGDPRYYIKANGTAYRNHSPHFCDSMTVYANCYKAGVVDVNDPTCGVTVNKPSFFVR